MIKFETINGTLCRMVEPEPLTDDVKFPVAVEIFGKQHILKDKYQGFIPIVFAATYMDMSLHQAPFLCYLAAKIIGYPVADGSLEWALYQMMQGKKVRYKGDGGNVYWALNQDGNVQYYDMSCLAYVGTIRSKLEFGERKWDNHIWQLYEEKPEPEPKFAVGDWVEFRDIEGIKHGIIEGRREEYSVLCNGVSQSVGDKFITRKLNPSEIVLDFGNGIKGTIRRYRGEQIRIYDGDINFACLAISYVTEPMQTTVRKLLAAIEEEQ